MKKLRCNAVRTISFILPLFLTICVASATVFADVRDRVIVKDSNVFTDTYQPLRCANVFLYEGTVAAMEYGLSEQEIETRWQANEDYLRNLVDEFGYNCVRVGPWHYRIYPPNRDGGVVPGSGGAENWNVYSARAQSMVQRYVDAAGELGFYVMLNDHSSSRSFLRDGYTYSNPTETIDGLSNVKAFWNLYGEKYKNNTNVIFELINEPEPVPEDYPNMVELYQHVRALAPDTHLIAWSLVVTEALSTETLEQYRGSGSNGIDYSNASVGFHTYSRDGLTAWEDAWDWQLAGFPVISTEFQSYRDPLIEEPVDLPHYLTNLALAERLGVGWSGWMYEASVQSDYFNGGSQIKFPENFLEEAEKHGVLVNGWEVDNKRQIAGELPQVSLDFDNSAAFLDDLITLKVETQSAIEVSYYSGNTKIGTSTAAPDFSFNWTNASVGRHKITARAKSSSGVYYRSAPKTIAVYNTSGIVFDNQSFENGGQLWFGARSSAVPVMEQAYEGNYSLKYTEPEVKPSTGRYGANKDIRHFLRAFGPGTYELSYAIRAVSGSNMMEPKIFLQDQAPSTKFTQREMTTEWQSYTDSVNLNWNVAEGKRPVFFNFRPNDDDSFYVDNVSLRKTSAVLVPAVEGDIPASTPAPTATPTPIATSTATPIPTATPTSAPTVIPVPTLVPDTGNESGGGGGSLPWFVMIGLLFARCWKKRALEF